MQRQAAILREALANLRGFDWSELRQVAACGHWPSAVHAVIAAVSFMMVVLLACLLLGPGLLASWSAARDRSEALSHEYSALTSELAGMSARRQNMAWQNTLTAGVHKSMLGAASMPVVLDRLRILAASRGMTVISLRPEQMRPQFSGLAFEIDLEVQAEQRQLAAFLGDIEALPLALVIRQADWQQDAARARLRFFLLVADRGGQQNHKGLPGRYRRDGADQQLPVGAADWQRIAFIQRGSRFLEVLRDADGETRTRRGDLKEAAP